MTRSKARGVGLSLAALMLGPCVTFAHPYASGVTNDNGTIRFILNESADSVKVAFNSGTVTNDLGALAAGPQSFALGAHTNYSIIVYKVGPGIPTQISADTNIFNSFYGPRAVAVNKNPKSAYFGRIYVGQGAAGTSSSSGTARTVGRGIYLLNADQSDALGRGDTASSAGITWGTSSTLYSPYKMSVGQDDQLYIADATTDGGGMFVTDPDVNTSSQVLAGRSSAGAITNNHGRVTSSPMAFGSLSGGNLVVYDVDTDYPTLATGNYVQRYDINGGPLPYSGTPVQGPYAGLSGYFVISDLAIAPDGKHFISQNRANYAGNTSLRVYDSDGATLLWDDNTANGGAGTPLVNSYSVAVSPDGQYVATCTTDGKFTLMKLTNGLPDLSTLTTNSLAGDPGTTRQVSFDLADNLYTVSGGSEHLRVHSLGMTTTTVYSNDQYGTNGSFEMSVPSTSVNVVATVPYASQGRPAPIQGVFTITRSGQLDQPLTVNFSLGGTASNGTYTASATSSVTIAAGNTSADVTITPINDGVPRFTNTVVLTLQGGPNYGVAPPAEDTIYIENTATPQIVVTEAPAPTMYERFSTDYGSVTISRMGDTSVALTLDATNLQFGGTAVRDTDYVVNPNVFPIFLDYGAVSTTVNLVSPLDNSTYGGNKTILVSTLAGTGFTGNSTPATLTIIDDENPPAPVLWSDPLTDSADANNWNLTFAWSDMVNSPIYADDYFVNFGFDLASGGISLPPNGASTALRVTCNKTYNPGLSAAVNLYPTNVSFSGDYAVRFNMNLIQNAGAASGTEGVLFGVNHNGTQTNFWSGSGVASGGPWASDGVFYWIDATPGGAAAGDYIEYTGNGGALPNTGWQNLGVRWYYDFSAAFKNPELYTCLNYNGDAPGPGIPANAPGMTATWSDVEIKQVNNVVTLSINKTPIHVYNNTTTFKSGTIMLGYDDPFNSQGAEGAAYFSNVRVVRLGDPVITSFNLSGGNVVVQFTTSDGQDTTDSFALQSSGTVNGTFTDIAPAPSITQLPDGTFQVTTAQSGPTQFYRIRHK